MQIPASDNTQGTATVLSAQVQEVLQIQLAELTDRMAVAGCELERLREEREELQYQVRYMYDMLAAKTGEHSQCVSSCFLAGVPAAEVSADTLQQQPQPSLKVAQAIVAECWGCNWYQEAELYVCCM